MTVLYIQPTPGNGKGYLRNTYDALREQKFSVKVVGYGYPPIFIDVEDKFKDTVIKLAEDACEGNVQILDSHRLKFEDESSVTEVQPHEEFMRIASIELKEDERDNLDRISQKYSPVSDENPPEIPEEEKKPDLELLKRILADTLYFTEGELRNLSLSLKIDYATLPGGGSQFEKAESLVDSLDNRNRIAELVEKIKNLRPKAWEMASVNDARKR
jgi:hypothetical protein